MTRDEELVTISAHALVESQGGDTQLLETSILMCVWMQCNLLLFFHEKLSRDYLARVSEHDTGYRCMLARTLTGTVSSSRFLNFFDRCLGKLLNMCRLVALSYIQLTRNK